MNVLLYTRRGCHLCEAAALARYDLRVPVLEIDGRVVLEGRFDERSLAAALAAAGEVRGRG